MQKTRSTTKSTNPAMASIMTSVRLEPCARAHQDQESVYVKPRPDGARKKPEPTPQAGQAFRSGIVVSFSSEGTAGDTECHSTGTIQSVMDLIAPRCTGRHDL